MRSDGGIEGDLKNTQAWSDGRNDGRSRFRSVEYQNVDGRRQVVMHSLSGHEKNKLFLNQQGTDFVNASPLSGLDSVADGRAFGLLDFDHDGLQDIALINTNEPHLQIFRNNHRQARELNNGFVAVKLVGGNQGIQSDSGLSCRDGYGAKVVVTVGESRVFREHRCGEGFSSQNSDILIIGIGESEKADRIEIRWPSGAEQSVENVKSGSKVICYENDDGGQSKTVIEDYDGIEKSTGQAVIAAVEVKRFEYPELADDGANLRVLVAMATWCESCKSHIKPLGDLQTAMGESIKFYGLPIDPTDDLEKLEEYEQKLELPYRLLKNISEEDRNKFSDHILEELRTKALPASVITNASGIPIAINSGIPTISEIRRMLKAVSADD